MPASSGWNSCKHIPDRHEHMVRYYGRYSSRTRARSTSVPNGRAGPKPKPAREPQDRWAKMIRKVYEVIARLPEWGADAVSP